MYNNNFESVGSILGKVVRNRSIGRTIKCEQLDIFNIKEEVKDDPNESFEEWMKNEEIRREQAKLDIR